MHSEILLVPPSNVFMNGRIFELDEKNRGYETSKPYRVLRDKFRQLGFEMKTIDQSEDISSAQAIIFFETRSDSDYFYKMCLEKKLDDKMYLITLEPSAVHPPNHDPGRHMHFRGVLTWNEDLVDNRKYFKLFYTLPIRFGEKIIVPRIPFGQKKLLCLISSNKYSSHPKELYSERVNTIRFMEKNHPNDFDLYGVGWDYPVIYNSLADRLKINAAIFKFWPKSMKLKRYRSYRGKIDYKKEILPKYKFTIAYENELDGNGYVTEKILEAFLHGCVPIYLGDRNVAKRIPANCFIDKREYPTYEKLYEQLSTMTNEEHAAYLDNIEKFLNSRDIYPFTIDSMIESFERLLGITIRKTK